MSIDNTIRDLILYIGDDSSREGLLETPSRVAKAYNHWFSGYNVDISKVFKTFEDGGENYDQMIQVGPINFYSHCEHHIAPFFGKVHIGYIPDRKIAGLSKFSRCVDGFARRLQVQERLTSQIAECINTYLKPKGVGVFIKARHLCMESRGICKPGIWTKTSSLSGIIKDRDRTRKEFFDLIKGV